MKNIFTFLLILISTSILGQTKYELGYYIDQSGNKIEGEISEIRADKFPSEFYIKKDNQQIKMETKFVNEISYGAVYFVKKRFKFDPSVRYEIGNLDFNKNLNLVETEDFLQRLVDGQYTLYRYIHNGVASYFYQRGDNEITTLIYKKYRGKNYTINENNDFKVQLLHDVKNNKYNNLDDYFTLRYTQENLEDYFKEANGISFNRLKKQKVLFNFFVGYSMHTMDLNFLSNIDQKTHNGLTVMPELEFMFNRFAINPTSFYVNGKLHTFKSEFIEEYVRENWHHTVDYKSLYVSIGAKQYFMSSPNIQFYGKFGVGINNPIKYKINSPEEARRLRLIVLDRFAGGINTGLGAKLFNSILVEVNYDFVFNTLYINKNTALNFKIGYTF
ncbi:hypothetical protein [Paenimyroides aestuarii]|uniref:Outer membrane protein beta-barrel domain-containing protein n=1 Tax=Paenimyroides aestuarii TaxID=2968490 RepID=A0ABY5NVY5_9FLAO|nr:hypothetical protein [Paenimyroides aestuarii]UUV22751.1 hypothetical protein NPX36_06845 [Paenimyroides aestuarii]